MSPATLNDIFIEVENFTRFQRIIGMSALIYSNGKLQISKKWFIINLLSTFSLILIFYTVFIPISKSLTSVSNWYYYLKTLYSMILMTCIVTTWIHGNRNVELLNMSLARMKAVDLLMLKLGKKMPPTKPSWVTAVLYSLMIAAFFFKVVTMPSFSNGVILFILYAPYVHILSLEDTIERIDSLLLLRFSTIKKHLLDCFRMESQKTVTNLEKLVQCYHHLCCSSAHIDKYLSVFIIVQMSVIFLASFCEVYAFSVMYKDETMLNKGVLLTEKALWILIIIILVWRICHQFAAISTKAKEFSTNLFYLMINDETDKILNNAKLKLHIAMNREVDFTAHGFVKLDYSLLHSMIASSTTCLVIVFQFSIEQPSLDINEASSVVGNSTATAGPTLLTTL